MHRDGSACGRPLGSRPSEREAETAPNSYAGSGSLDSCPVRERRPCLRSRPRNLSVPHGVSSKQQARPLRRVTVSGRRRLWESRPTKVEDDWGFLLESRIGSVSAWLVVRAAQAGDGSTLSHVSSTAGPRRGGQSKGNGVGHSTHRAKGNQRDRVSHSLLACSCVRPGVPQFGKQLPAPGRLFS
jgi:hypothetical protein